MPSRGSIKFAAACLLWLAFAATNLHADAFSSTGSRRVFVSTPVKVPRRLVGDCMSIRPPTLSSSTSVDEAIAFLLEYRLSGAPVVDDDGKLVGVVSEFDFLSKEAGGTLLPMEGSQESIEQYIRVAQKIIGRRVGDMMTRNPVVISPTQSMREAAAVMVQERLHHLPVVEENGRLVGILSSAHIMLDVQTVARSALPEAAEEDDDEDE